MAGAAARSRRHAVLSLTTTFRLPHEGMGDMEYLSRGSAFLLDTSRSNSSSADTNERAVFGRDLAVLTCQHVACPWLFPQYFADKWEWLQHVSEEFVQHSLQLLELPPPSAQVFVSGSGSGRHQHGQHHHQLFVPKVLDEIPLQRHVWLHPSRDLAMLSLGESLADVDWDKYASGNGDDKWVLELLALQDVARSPASGDVVLFTGHKQFSFESTAAAAAAASSGARTEEEQTAMEDVGQFPKEVLGRFVGASSQGQAFAWSEEILEEGMCGGAVVSAEGDCVGLIEGIVPPFVATDASSSSGGADDNHEDSSAAMRKALENHVAFIPSREIAAFVVERGPLLSTGTLLGLDEEDEDDLW